MTRTVVDAAALAQEPEAEAKRKLNLPGRCPSCGTEGTVRQIQLHINTARCSAHRDGTATSDLHEVWLAAHPPEPETVIIDGGANPAADSTAPPQAAPDPACSGMNHQTGEDCKNRPVPGRDVCAVHLKQEAEQQLGLCPCGQVGTIEQLEQEHIAGCIEHLAAKDDGEPDLRRLYLEHRQEADEREARIRAGAPQVTSWLADVFAAYEARHWEVYGYDDWDSYTAARLPELRKALADKDERARAIGWLSDAGMSTRAIAQATGTSKSTVHRQLSQNGTDTDSDGSAGTGDSGATGDAGPGQVLSRDGARRPARQTATQRESRRRQREALAEAREHDGGQAGTSEVPAVAALPAVTHGNELTYETACKRLKALCGKVHKLIPRDARLPRDLPDGLFVQSREPTDATLQDLIREALEVLHGNPEVTGDPAARAAEAAVLPRELARATAERDELRQRNRKLRAELDEANDHHRRDHPGCIPELDGFGPG